MFDFIFWLFIAALIVYFLPTIIRLTFVMFALFGALVLTVCFLIAVVLSLIFDRKGK